MYFLGFTDFRAGFGAGWIVFAGGRADSSVKKGAAQGIPGGRRAGKRAARRDGGLLAWMGGKRLRDKGWLAWIVNR